MKKALAVSLLFGTVSAIAAPPPDRVAPGIYTADTTVSHAPPQVSAVLVEPNGEFWAMNYTHGGRLWAQGGVSLRTGNGKTGEIPNSDKLDLIIRPSSSAAAIANTFTFYDKGLKALSFHAHHPMAKRQPFDFPYLLNGNFNSLWQIPFNNYTSSYGTQPSGGKFRLNIGGVSFSGSDGDCVFSGKFANQPQRYKRVTIVYTSDCYRDPGASNASQVKAGTMMSGVMFPLRHEGWGWNGFMLLLKGERGNKGESLSEYFVTSITP